MKKNKTGRILDRILKTKVLIMMRLIVFFFFASTFSLIASGTYSQNKTITMNKENVLIKDVLSAIEDQCGYFFIYNNEFVDVYKRINVQAENQEVTKLLDEVFSDQQVSYQINERRIILKANANVAYAQKAIKVTGKVTDTSGAPLPGVTVVVKGTTNGTITNFDGVYTLSDVPSDGIIQFSFVGMKMQEVSVAGKTSIDITMEEDAIGIEEVVAVGYGTVRKSDLTGSVAKVNAEDLENAGGTSFDQQLAGRLSGVQITQQSGAPGAGSVINVRGFNSFSNSQPLIVIDGYPIEMGNFESSGEALDNNQDFNPLALINPNDIESIEVLKDASSTAIYGSRGANGVILITTKSGNKGVNKVTYNYKFDISRLGKDQFYDLLDTRSYMEYVNEAYVNGGLDPKYDPSKIDSLVQVSPNTNWQEEIYRTAQTHEHSLNFTGADDISKYNVTLGYLDQEGIILNSNFKRFSIRSNASRKIGKNFEIGSVANYVRTDSKQAAHSYRNGDTGGSVVLGSLFFKPLDLPYSSDLDEDEVVSNNPVVVATLKKDDTEIQLFYTKLFANLTITDGLTFNFNGGINSRIQERNQYQPRGTFRGTRENGYASTIRTSGFNYLTEFTLRYNKVIRRSHRINAVTGFTYQNWLNKGLILSVGGFVNDNLGYENFAAGANVFTPRSWKTETALASWIGRANYVFKDRYLLTVTGRYDGSTRLGEGNKWDFFPSFAVGWNVHKESFLEQLTFVSKLKLRTSYGITGSQSIVPNQLVQNYEPTGYPVNGIEEKGLTTSTMLANPLLAWESTKQLDVGTDLGFLNNKISISFEYYKKQTENLLNDLQIARSTGFWTIPINTGLVENKGWEMEASANILNKKVKWKISCNLSHNINKLIELGDLEKTFGRTYISASTISAGESVHIAQVGQPIGLYYGYEISGIFQNQNQIDNYVNESGEMIQPNAKPGDFIYVNQITEDSDGDGILDAGDAIINDKDRAVIGNPYPDLIFGFSNNLSYKGFQLDFFVQGSLGNDVINLNKYVLSDPNSATNFNITRDAYENAWRGEGTTNRYQSPRSSGVVNDGIFSNFLIEDGSYIRLKNITLSYYFDMSRIKYVKGLKLFAGGNNLVTLTNYSGYDPEVSGMGKTAMDRGIDWGTYPMARSVFMGLNIEF